MFTEKRPHLFIRVSILNVKHHIFSFRKNNVNVPLYLHQNISNKIVWSIESILYETYPRRSNPTIIENQTIGLVRAKLERNSPAFLCVPRW